MEREATVHKSLFFSAAAALRCLLLSPPAKRLPAPSGMPTEGNTSESGASAAFVDALANFRDEVRGPTGFCLPDAGCQQQQMN